ncbi:MAG: 50S ribosomal protein L15 [Candidatus Omnitrophica bacterium]|nr:50S ribosomal protein L15 [Candidatus Omnitrophota bacterium]
MNLSQIRIARKKKKNKRVGRGTGSGHGKTSGRGHKGSGQRVGTKFYVGAIGGNVPFFRKIPKRGFTSVNPMEYQIVNLESVKKKMKDAPQINPQTLKKAQLISDEKMPVKILGRIKGDFKTKATFSAHRFSKKAEELIKNAGGSVECLKP